VGKITKNTTIMKKILGLDLGTNSIGWAVVSTDENGTPTHIEGMGSRIIPMGSDKIDYEKGATITKNADRRAKRSARRMGKRYKMRRNKLLFILSKLNMLPEQIQFKTDFPEATKIQDLELLPIAKYTMQLDSLQHYELREKALHEQITLQELGKIFYQYNRLRGYSGGGDDNESKKEKVDDDDNKKYEVRVQKFLIKDVVKSDITYTAKSGKDKGSELPIYNIIVIDEDEEIEGTTKLQTLSDKIGEEIELEIRIKKTKKGDNIAFALPQKTNWRKQMEGTELLLKTKHYYPCQLFAEDLRNNKWTKIRNRVILREQYKREFDAVWAEQAKYYPILEKCPNDVLHEIVSYIFPGPSDSQKKLREIGLKNGLKYIIKEQIIYYQRPLKSQSDLIGTCQFEKEEKVIPITHPLFQEFRCWDQINRLYIRSKQQIWNEKKGKFVLQYQNRYLTEEQKYSIYNRLQEQKQLGFKEVAKIVNLRDDQSEFLNGLHVKAKLSGCDTRISIKKILKGYCEPDTFLIENIWEAVYNNVHEGSEYDESSKRVLSIINALPEILGNEQRTELALKIAQNIKFVRKYASLSKKAIENILPIMRPNPKVIPEKVKKNFEDIKWLIDTGEVIDESILQDYIIDFVKNNPQALVHGGLMYAFASSLVYGRHTKEEVKPQLKDYHEIKYVERNLRNPIVEQIANETMQVVKALWKQYHLHPDELEIRVELARDLKNSAQERDNIFKAQNKNRNSNERIKERLKQENVPVTDLNILKYKLYEQQSYISPYTKKTISFSKLFDDNFYNIDHIIPKSRYFDDSIANKVICESNINEEKDNRTAWEYISQQSSQFAILTPEDYLNHINSSFFGQKKKNLLAEKIPSNPVARQMKDTQYISIAVKDELAKIVGSEHVKTTTGSVTDYLRSQWGLRRLFMELTEDRFKQMELWSLNEDGTPKESWIRKGYDETTLKNVYEIKGWSKRYDHRHHSIDALVVALCNEKFVKRLNDLNKYFQEELAKHKSSIPIIDEDSIELAFFNLPKEKRNKIMQEIESSRKFDAPFDNLVAEAKYLLESMIVSQKPKDKLSIKEDLNGKKQLKIRAALHQETYYGKTNGRDTKTIAISMLKAKDIPQIIDEILKNEIDSHRKKYDSMKEAFTGEGLIAFNESRFQAKNRSALKPPVYKVKLWYSNKEKETGNLQPLYGKSAKKTVVTGDNYMFIVMGKGGKRDFTIASLYDSVSLAKEYLKQGIVDIESIKKNICDDLCVSNGENGKDGKADHVLFYLQQNDLVYMPKEDDELLRYNELELKKWFSDTNNRIDFAKRVYKVVKFTGNKCYFIPNNYAKEISIPKDFSKEEIEKLKSNYKDKAIPKQEQNYIEFGTYSNCTPFEKNELFTLSLSQGSKYDGAKPRKIQDYCIKIKTDWLGNVIKFNGISLL
jgi:CRISPR/Cas system Type II protein with McrA/HNH and RuvC-like nuclease domain